VLTWRLHPDILRGVQLSITVLPPRARRGGENRVVEMHDGGASIDSQAIPQRKLYTGATMPAIGLGTFGSDHVTPAQVAGAVRGAAAAGYRHFDCASVYGNEPEVGGALQSVISDGIKRRELWITSKLWNDKHGEDDVIASCRKSLADLRLEYLDLYLVHWPFPNFHPPGCDVTSRSADSKPQDGRPC